MKDMRILLAVGFCLGLAACGSKERQPDTADQAVMDQPLVTPMNRPDLPQESPVIAANDPVYLGASSSGLSH